MRPLEVRDVPLRARSDRRMYSKPLACSPFCCRGRFEKSCAGIGGQRGSSHSHGLGRRGPASARSPSGEPCRATRSPSASPPGPAGGTGTTRRCCTSAGRSSAGSSGRTCWFDPLRLELVEVRDVGAPPPMPAHDRVVQRAVPGRRRRRPGRRGARCHAGPRRRCTSLACAMPGHALAHRAQVLDVRLDERAVDRRSRHPASRTSWG